MQLLINLNRFSSNMQFLGVLYLPYIAEILFHEKFKIFMIYVGQPYLAKLQCLWLAEWLSKGKGQFLTNRQAVLIFNLSNLGLAWDFL